MPRPRGPLMPITNHAATPCSSSRLTSSASRHFGCRPGTRPTTGTPPSADHDLAIKCSSSAHRSPVSTGSGKRCLRGHPWGCGSSTMRLSRMGCAEVWRAEHTPQAAGAARSVRRAWAAPRWRPRGRRRGAARAARRSRSARVLAPSSLIAGGGRGAQEHLAYEARAPASVDCATRHVDPHPKERGYP